MKMLKIENVDVFGLYESVRGSKFPMAVDLNLCDDVLTERTKSLASCKIGTGHDNFLNGIIVQFDLTFTIKAWTEAQRYHFLDFVSSQSTMHKITKFDLSKQYIEYVDPRIIKIMQEKVDAYNKLQAYYEDEKNNMSKSESRRIKITLDGMYLEILYSNPCGFRLTARMTTNYRQLKTIYFQRKSHRLPEWVQFCEWIERLPLFKELILNNE